jgi:hypothetical protein
MNDVGGLVMKELAEGSNLQEREEGLLVNGQGDVFGAFLLQALHEQAAVGDHKGLVSPGGEEGSHFQGPALDAAGIEIRKYLENLHAGVG